MSRYKQKPTKGAINYNISEISPANEPQNIENKRLNENKGSHLDEFKHFFTFQNNNNRLLTIFASTFV